MNTDTKHTPGPWTVTTGEHTETTDLYDKGETWFNVNGEEGVIADVLHGRCLTQDEDEAAANAALIAAAPDMFEAMQEFVDRVERGEVRSKKTYEKFKAILSKANPSFTSTPR